MHATTHGVETPTEPQPVEMPGLWHRGVDLNRASAEEMVQRIDGIGHTLALAIVQNRAVFGPFLHLRDLARVPGIGPRNFSRITGLVWRADGLAHRAQVMKILAPTPDGDLDLPGIAKRLAGTKGFAGCLITDQDGQLVAGDWSDHKQEALGALAPYLIGKLAPSLHAIEAGSMDGVTIFAGEQAITMIPVDRLVLVAVQEANRFSRRQLRVVQQVAETIIQLLFRPDQE